MASKELKIVIDAQNNASREFKKLKKDISGIGKSFSFETNLIKKATKYALLGATGLAAGLGAFAVKSAFASARIDELNFALHAIGKANNISKKSIDKTVGSLRGMNIAHKQALQITSLFIQSQLKLTDAVKIATAAKDLAVVAGMDSSEATEQLTNAVVMQRPMLLRQFGIVKGLDQIYGEYAKTHKIAATQLTETQKKQAFLNTILEQGKKTAGTYEAAMGSVSKRYRSLTGRIIPDFIAQVGQAFKPALNVAVSNFTEGIKKLSKWFKDNNDKVKAFGTMLGNWFQKKINEAIEITKRWYKSIGGREGLEAKFKSLWNTLTTEIIPAIVDTIKIVEKITKFVYKHRKAVLLAIIAWETLKTILVIAPVIKAAIASLTAFIQFIKLSTAEVGLLQTAISLLGVPIVITIGIGSIFAAIKAAQKLKGALDDAADAQDKAIGNVNKFVQDTREKYKKGKIDKDEYKKRLREAEKMYKNTNGYRATGGSVMAGQRYIVGENGAEVFIPSTSGRIEKNTTNNKSENIYNFDFAGAVIGDKKSLIDEIKASIGREQELHRLGAI